ncbi:hypothetical protein FH972_025527 [Carpinus fangiana]|uniref:Uncharacterized protein n=1 Tax=Carpinus fangiana TaxID=176857 RepID=A0A5N6L1A3_9ROSI|nr:hypothetical protein FH972_025527 [Carpinus fangiana]
MPMNSSPSIFWTYDGDLLPMQDPSSLIQNYHTNILRFRDLPKIKVDIDEKLLHPSNHVLCLGNSPVIAISSIGFRERKLLLKGSAIFDCDTLYMIYEDNTRLRVGLDKVVRSDQAAKFVVLIALHVRRYIYISPQQATFGYHMSDSRPRNELSDLGRYSEQILPDNA